ncbi:MAG: S8 family serine peptidase [Eubacteriales bacterium]|nr:S8 family serine peptidase [Eubacteriales bacterium]
MKRKKRHEILRSFFSLLLVVSLLLGPASVLAEQVENPQTSLNQQEVELMESLREEILAKVEKEMASRAEYQEEQELLEDYARELNRSEDELIRVMVSFEPGANLEAIKELISDTLTEVQFRHDFSLLNSLSLSCRRSKISAIQHLPGVIKVEEVPRFDLKIMNAVGMTEVKEVAAEYGLKGEGMVIAVIDTGVTASHPAMRISEGTQVKLSREKVEQLIQEKGLLGRYVNEKIPYAFNYVDLSDVTDIEANTGSHGLHCAGIIAGNTSPDQPYGKQITGVAPEAQILNLKVFSDGGGGAYSDDVILAIEEAVALGADVISMSLGSPSAVVAENGSYSEAIARANAAGTLVVVANGNEGLSSSDSGDEINTMGLKDSGIAGSPANFPEALAVASVQNTAFITAESFYQIDQEQENRLPLGPQSFGRSITELSGPAYELVDCGLGKKESFPADLSGKVALVERGEITFQDKILNAQEAGAEAIIIYQNVNITSQFMGFGVEHPEDVTIGVFAAFMEPGRILKAALNEGKNVTIRFTDNKIAIPSSEAGAMSAFTSWGPTIELKLKPEISAPGGNIYSSVDEGGEEYSTSSGTSMACPHVAGAAALIKQAMQEKGLNRPELIKAVLMNTSVPTIAPNGIPYSPRQQGSGLMKVKRAIDSRIYALSNGQAVIELGAFSGPVNAPLSLSNYGDKEIKFKLKPQAAYSENTVAGKPVEEFEINAEAAVPSVDEITVAAGETVELSYSFDPSGSENNFFEGYILLESLSEGQPDLSIPFFGFNGEWSKEDVAGNAMIEAYKGCGGRYYSWKAPNGFAIESDENIKYWYPEYNTTNGMTVLKTLVNQSQKEVIAGNGSEYLLPYETIISFGYSEFLAAYLCKELKLETMGFSPNDDGEHDVIWPQIALRRAVKKAEAFIVKADANGEQELRQLLHDNSWAAPSYFYVKRARRSSSVNLSFASWDGLLYNPESGYIDKKAEEGQYIYRIKADLAGDGHEQILDLPFALDITAPVLNYHYVIPGNPEAIFTPFYVAANDRIFIPLLIEDPDLADGSPGVGFSEDKGIQVTINGRSVNPNNLFASPPSDTFDFWTVTVSSASTYLNSALDTKLEVQVEDYVKNLSEPLEFDQIRDFDTSELIIYQKGNETLNATPDQADPDIDHKVFVPYNIADLSSASVIGDAGNYQVKLEIITPASVEAKLSLNGQVIPPASSADSQYLIPLGNEGTYELNCEYSHSDGSVFRKDKVVLLLDLQAPRLVIDQPTVIGNFTTVPENTPALSLRAHLDPDAGEEETIISYIAVPLAGNSQKENGTLERGSDGVYTGIIKKSDDGVVNGHIVMITARDLAGNTSEELFLIGTDGDDFTATFARYKGYISFEGIEFYQFPRYFLNDDTLEKFGLFPAEDELTDSSDTEIENEDALDPESNPEDEPEVNDPSNPEGDEDLPIVDESPDDSEQPGESEAETEPTPSGDESEEDPPVVDPEPSESESEPIEEPDGQAQGRATAEFISLRSAAPQVLQAEPPEIYPELPFGEKLSYGYKFPRTGKLTHPDSKLEINGVEVDSDIYGNFKVVFLIGEDRINQYNVKVTLQDGSVVVNTKLRIYYDPRAPKVKTEIKPTPLYDPILESIAEDKYKEDLSAKIWTNEDNVDIEVKAHIDDRGFGAFINLNGNRRQSYLDPNFVGFGFRDNVFSYEEIVPTAVENWLLIEVGDDFNNFYRERIQVLRDTSAPLVTIFRSPDQDEAKESENPNFTWSSEDPESGIISEEVVVLKKNGDKWETYPYTAGEPLPPGEYQITVIATNNAGLISSASSSIKVLADQDENETEETGLSVSLPTHVVYDINEDPNSILAKCSASRAGQQLIVEIEDPASIYTSIPGSRGTAYFVIRDPQTGEVILRLPFSYRVRNEVPPFDPNAPIYRPPTSGQIVDQPFGYVYDEYPGGKLGTGLPGGKVSTEAKVDNAKHQGPVVPVPVTGESSSAIYYGLISLLAASLFLALKRRH